MLCTELLLYETQKELANEEQELFVAGSERCFKPGVITRCLFDQCNNSAKHKPSSHCRAVCGLLLEATYTCCLSYHSHYRKKFENMLDKILKIRNI